MKIKIAICLLLSFLVSYGCEKQNEAEVISLDDPAYLSYNDGINKGPELRNISFETMEEIKSEMHKHTEGVVLLYTRIYLDERGRVNKIGLLHGVNSDFNRYALSKIKQLRFIPAMKNNKPVKFYFDGSIKKLGRNFLMSPELDADTIDSKFLVEVEQMPEPVGGISAIVEKVHYPEPARSAKVEGTVYVQANIDEQGNVVETKVIKAVEPSLDEAAVKAVKEVKFTPGRDKGKPVKVQIVVPIKFQLQ